jgi:hypothetical protein
MLELDSAYACGPPHILSFSHKKKKRKKKKDLKDFVVHSIEQEFQTRRLRKILVKLFIERIQNRLANRGVYCRSVCVKKQKGGRRFFFFTSVSHCDGQEFVDDWTHHFELFLRIVVAQVGHDIPNANHCLLSHQSASLCETNKKKNQNLQLQQDLQVIVEQIVDDDLSGKLVEPVTRKVERTQNIQCQGDVLVVLFLCQNLKKNVRKPALGKRECPKEK